MSPLATVPALRSIDGRGFTVRGAAWTSPGLPRGLPDAISAFPQPQDHAGAQRWSTLWFRPCSRVLATGGVCLRQTPACKVTSADIGFNSVCWGECCLLARAFNLGLSRNLVGVDSVEMRL